MSSIPNLVTLLLGTSCGFCSGGNRGGRGAGGAQKGKAAPGGVPRRVEQQNREKELEKMKIDDL